MIDMNITHETILVEMEKSIYKPELDDVIKFGNWTMKVCERTPRDGSSSGLCLEVECDTLNGNTKFRMFENTVGWINTGDGKRTIYPNELRE